MKKVHGLKDWILDKSIPNSRRVLALKIGLKYPDENQFIELKPKERIKKIDDIFSSNLQQLLALKLFETYEVNGTKKKTTCSYGKSKIQLIKHH